MIQIQGIHKWFGEHHVLRGVDLTIKEGETVVIIGRSGCGKSAGKPMITLRELHAHNLHVAHDTLSRTATGQITTRLPAGVRRLDVTSEGTTVTTGPTLARTAESACARLSVLTLTVNPLALACLIARRLPAVKGLWV